MKFDYVIGNPPYGSKVKGTQFVWRKFIRKSVELADHKVIMICPYHDKNCTDGHDSFAGFVETRKISENENAADYFDVGIPNIKTLELSPYPFRNYVQNKTELYADYINPYPDRYTIGDMIGNRAISGVVSADLRRGIVTKADCYPVRKNIENEIFLAPSRNHKNWKDPIERWKIIPQEVYDHYARKNDGRITLNAKYLLTLSKSMSGGKPNMSIIKGGTLLSTWCMIIVPFDTYDEAQRLREWLQSDLIIGEMNKLHKMRIEYIGDENLTATISQEQFKLLPWYE